MSHTLELRLLGGLNIGLTEKPPLRFASRRAEVLLAYVAMNPQLHSRESLATLLWDDRDQKQAMANLRSLLAQLPKALKPYLNITRQHVAFREGMPVWVDALVFMETGDWRLETRSLRLPQSLVSSSPVSQLEEAAALYKGGFLDGVFVRESRGLEEWTAVMRERLQQQAIHAFSQLAHVYLYRRDYAPAIQHTQALLALDPLREGSHCLLMRLLARNGQLNAAIQQYEQCRAVLDKELGVEPSPQTRQLYQRLLSAKLPAPFVVPSLQTPFVGREEELALIEARLDDEQCRLLTLLGTGGVGKTRLALQTAVNRRRDYLHGIYFISLAELETAEFIPAAIANALGLPLQGRQSPAQQLVAALTEREMLLILDNLEHLLEGVVPLLQQILAEARDVQLLITSRERLHLQAEWLLPIEGLPFPTKVVDEVQGAAFGSMRLFAVRAQQVVPRFRWETAVAQICQLVEGLPLGIELAAAALPYHSASQIAVEIQQNLDFLATKMRDVPARHRSIRAVFTHSWSLLSALEQEVFCVLSVFRGGFDEAAAMAVTSGKAEGLLPDLAAKSLLQVGENGRYTLHELLRQFGLEKLQTESANYEIARQAHTVYFASFLQGQEAGLRGWRQQTAIQTIQLDWDNVQSAWRWLVAQKDAQVINLMVAPLYRFCHMNGRFQTGVILLQSAIDVMVDKGVLVRLQARQAALLTRLAEYDRAFELLNESEEQAEKLELAAELAFIHGVYGRLAWTRSQFAEAQAHYDQALSLAQANGDTEVEAIAQIGLGNLAHTTGQSDYGRAADHFAAGLKLYEEVGDKWGIAQATFYLAYTAEKLGNYETAEQHLRHSLSLRRELGDRSGEISTLIGLAHVVSSRDTGDTGLAYYEEALPLAREIGRRLSVGIILGNMGMIQSEAGEYEAAVGLFRESLQISRDLDDDIGVIFCLRNLATLARKQGDVDKAESQYREALQVGEAAKATRELLITLFELALLWQDQAHKHAQAVALLQFLVADTGLPQVQRVQGEKILEELTAVPPSPLWTEQTLSAIMTAVLGV